VLEGLVGLADGHGQPVLERQAAERWIEHVGRSVRLALEGRRDKLLEEVLAQLAPVARLALGDAPPDQQRALDVAPQRLEERDERGRWS
jgi:hypothetical protein